VDKAKSQKIKSVQFIPPAINPAAPDLNFIRAQVQKALLEAEQPDPSPTPTPADGTKKKKKKKPAATPAPGSANVVPGESVSIDDTCRYS
jgi:polyisoprenyl-teichoic acid--peptidoglycan teichoic acid transferase